MVKTAKLKEEFTVSSNISVIIVEIVGIPIILLLLFWRFQVVYSVYSDTPLQVRDSLMSYWWRDMMGDLFWLYIIVAMLLVMWMVAKALRVWEREKKEKWWVMTLNVIAKRLNISDSDIDAEFRKKELNLELKKLKALPGQDEIQKTPPQKTKRDKTSIKMTLALKRRVIQELGGDWLFPLESPEGQV